MSQRITAPPLVRPIDAAKTKVPLITRPDKHTQRPDDAPLAVFSGTMALPPSGVEMSGVDRLLVSLASLLYGPQGTAVMRNAPPVQPTLDITV